MATYDFGFNRPLNSRKSSENEEDEEQEPEDLEDGKLDDDEEIVTRIGPGENRSSCFICEWEENSQDYFCMAEVRQKFYATLGHNMHTSGLMQNCIRASYYFNKEIVKYVNDRLTELNERQIEDGEIPFKAYKPIKSGVLYYHMREHRRTPYSMLMSNNEFNASLLSELKVHHVVKKAPNGNSKKIDFKAAGLARQYQQQINDNIKLMLALNQNK